MEICVELDDETVKWLAIALESYPEINDFNEFIKMILKNYADHYKKLYRFVRLIVESIVSE